MMPLPASIAAQFVWDFFFWIFGFLDFFTTYMLALTVLLMWWHTTLVNLQNSSFPSFFHFCSLSKFCLYSPLEIIIIIIEKKFFFQMILFNSFFIILLLLFSLLYCLTYSFCSHFYLYMLHDLKPKGEFWIEVHCQMGYRLAPEIQISWSEPILPPGDEELTAVQQLLGAIWPSVILVIFLSYIKYNQELPCCENEVHAQAKKFYTSPFKLRYTPHL